MKYILPILFITAALASACKRTSTGNEQTTDLERDSSTDSVVNRDTDTKDNADIDTETETETETETDTNSVVDTDLDAMPAFRLSDEYGENVMVVSDRQGNALVQWDCGVEVCFARWDHSEESWSTPPRVQLGDTYIIDTYASGYPILIGESEAVNADGSAVVVHRFDPERNEWGEAHPLPFLVSSVEFYDVRIDGAGNVHAYWRISGESAKQWSWWPVDGSAWRPAATVDGFSHLRTQREAGAWLWDQSGPGVRLFDLEAGQWSDEVALAPGSLAALHTFAVGRSGEALSTSLWREPTELIAAAHRYDPLKGTWQLDETIARLPFESDDDVLYRNRDPLTDAEYHDFVTIPVPLLDGTFDLHVYRYDPGTGMWSTSRVFWGAESSMALGLTADDRGNVYSYWQPDGSLLHYSASTDQWTDTPIDWGGCTLVTPTNGAFALDVYGDRLVAYRHAGADETWRPADGLPPDAQPSFSSSTTIPPIPTIGIVPVGDNGALVVWASDVSDQTGIWASFIE